MKNILIAPSTDPCAVKDLTKYVKELEEAGVGADGIDGIGHGVDVPVVGLDDVGENLAASGLLGYDAGRAALHSLERCDTEGLRYRRHDEHVAVLVAFIDLFAAHKLGGVAVVNSAQEKIQTIIPCGNFLHPVFFVVDIDLGYILDGFKPVGKVGYFQFAVYALRTENYTYQYFHSFLVV